jgi:hypothetical protein
VLPERPNPPPKPSIFRRVRDKIYSQIDPASIVHLLDFRPWFYPFTWKKYSVLFVLSCIIAGIVVSDHYTKWVGKSVAITRSYMLPVLIISVCAEPIIIFIILPMARMPDISQHEINQNMINNLDVEVAGSEKTLQPQGPFETALVVPCHDTDCATMRTTLESAFPHFRPQDIFIVDNGRTKYPSHPECNFRSYIRSIHPDIVYLWSPIASKNAAQLVGALAARNNGYKYVMSVDDDVCIPKNFAPPIEMIDDTFKAVAYPIKAIDAKCEVPLWLVAWQDVEYRLSGLSKLAEDRLCGVQFPHGAGWFVELDTFIELMEFYHPMDFIAEDCNAGLGMSKMGKGIRFDSRCYLATKVPTTFLGPGLNWWKQRQKSWEMGRHGRLFAFIRHFFFSMPPRKTIQGILWHKITLLYLICSILIDWLRIPVIIALGRTTTWWRNCILLMLFSALPPMAYNYWKCRRRPDMQIRFWAGFTYPWYKQLYLVVAIGGAIRWAGFFLGGHQAPPTIQQMLKKNDERCFWLDPRFTAHPAFLADEAEAIAINRESSLSPTSTLQDDYDPSWLQPDVSLEPPRASYSSAALRSTELELPQPAVGRSDPRPRLSPNLSESENSTPSWLKPNNPHMSSECTLVNNLIFESSATSASPNSQLAQHAHTPNPRLQPQSTQSSPKQPSHPLFPHHHSNSASPIIKLQHYFDTGGPKSHHFPPPPRKHSDMKSMSSSSTLVASFYADAVPGPAPFSPSLKQETKAFLNTYHNGPSPMILPEFQPTKAYEVLPKHWYYNPSDSPLPMRHPKFPFELPKGSKYDGSGQRHTWQHLDQWVESTLQIACARPMPVHQFRRSV